MGTQKKRLIEKVLLSTHNICFDWEMKKKLYTLLNKGLIYVAEVISGHFVDKKRISAGLVLKNWYSYSHVVLNRKNMECILAHKSYALNSKGYSFECKIKSADNKKI